MGVLCCLVLFESSVISGIVPEEINQTCCIECPPQWHLFSFIEYFIPQGIRQSALRTTVGFLSQESQVGSKVTLAEKLIIHLVPVLFYCVSFWLRINLIHGVSLVR
jgi:hypothetical protein